MELTCSIIGAFDQEISCPELRFGLYAEEINEEVLGRFYRALRAKSRIIVAEAETYPFPELIPYARLFMAHQGEIWVNLMSGEKILVTADETEVAQKSG